MRWEISKDDMSGLVCGGERPFLSQSLSNIQEEIVTAPPTVSTAVPTVSISTEKVRVLIVLQVPRKTRKQVVDVRVNRFPRNVCIDRPFGNHGCRNLWRSLLSGLDLIAVLLQEYRLQVTETLFSAHRQPSAMRSLGSPLQRQSTQRWQQGSRRTQSNQ